MTFEVPPISGIDRAPRVTPEPRPRTAPTGTAAPAVTVDTLPAVPPPEVLEQVAEAAEIAERLREMGRQLHFEPGGPNGRIIIEVRDLEGRVVRTVPPAESLAIATGSPL